jgi:hypothetical protein
LSNRLKFRKADIKDVGKMVQFKDLGESEWTSLMFLEKIGYYNYEHFKACNGKWYTYARIIDNGDDK